MTRGPLGSSYRLDALFPEPCSLELKVSPAPAQAKACGTGGPASKRQGQGCVTPGEHRCADPGPFLRSWYPGLGPATSALLSSSVPKFSHLETPLAALQAHDCWVARGGGPGVGILKTFPGFPRVPKVGLSVPGQGNPEVKPCFVTRPLPGLLVDSRAAEWDLSVWDLLEGTLQGQGQPCRGGPGMGHNEHVADGFAFPPTRESAMRVKLQFRLKWRKKGKKEKEGGEVWVQLGAGAGQQVG